jgi:hypothetical protein
MEAAMRWFQRHRTSRRAKTPRISISQEEILADLQYPAGHDSHPRLTPRRSRRV